MRRLHWTLQYFFFGFAKEIKSILFSNNGSNCMWDHNKIIKKKKQDTYIKVKWNAELGRHRGFFWKQNDGWRHLCVWLATNISHYLSYLFHQWMRSLIIFNEIDQINSQSSLSKLLYNILAKLQVISSIPLLQYSVVYLSGTLSKLIWWL